MNYNNKKNTASMKYSNIMEIKNYKLFTIFLIFLFAGIITTMKASDHEKGFKIKAYMMQIVTARIPLKAYKNKVKCIADAGFNTIILQLASSRSGSYQITGPGKVELVNCSEKEFKDFIKYIRSFNMKIGIGIRAFTKNMGCCSKLARKYPGIISNSETKVSFDKFLNPFYKFPNGENAMQAVQLPVIDFAINLCGSKKPDFIFLANDEGSIDVLHKLASQNKTSASQLYAWFLNTCSDYIIHKGIVPVMWGDMFLSKRLGEPGHGVKGFKLDPRFLKIPGSYNAEFLSSSQSVLTAMIYMKNKDNIIIADWHYSPRLTGEFPGVDYFQKMGFKDVWGATWYNDKNIAQFSRYAYEKGCGGMMSCSFHTMFSPNAKHYFPITVYNAICYFNNPFYVPPKIKSWDVKFNGKTVFNGNSTGIVKTAKKVDLRFTAIMPGSANYASGYLEIFNSTKHKSHLKAPLYYNAKSHTLCGKLILPVNDLSLLPEHYALRYNIMLKNPRYVIQKTFQNGIIVTDKKMTVLSTLRPEAQLNLDFSTQSKNNMNNQVFRASGKYSGLLYFKNTTGSKAQEAGSLYCNTSTKSFIFPADGFWDDIMKNGTKMTVELKLNKKLKNNGFTYIIGFGGYDGGIPVLLDSKMRLAVQMRNTSQGLQRIILAKMIPGKWYKLELVLSKPDNLGRRTLDTFVNGNKHKRITLNTTPIPPISKVMSIACFFKRASESLARPVRKNFDGNIRKLTFEKVK